jgi:hypothetical protein
MPTIDRMFRVIVVGGIALSATAPGLVAGCGGSVSSLPTDAGRGADAFPAEGPPPQQADAFFPQETAQFLDASLQKDATDAGVGIKDSGGDEDVFPQEGPNLEAGFFFDTGVPGTDAAAQPDSFPFETAAP